MDRLKEQLEQNINDICFDCENSENCVGIEECDKIQKELASFDRACMNAVDERMGK